MSGIAGLDFKDDIIALLNKWRSGNGGRKPTFTVVWKKKDIGRGNRGYDEVIVILDAENPNIFSLRRTDGSGNSIYDWLHDISISIDIWTSNGEKRSHEMVNEVVRLLKTNVLFNINNRQYVQLLPTGIEPLHEEYRNIYRWIVDVEAMRLNP
ncbi:MAG: hypothetical protein GWN01_01325 [Nitrosopumilaceae archaeon]|nr:hypothetical protein [Nitrosopumilaceae archaeon]NIU86000.1 hypothetical protein [Nitrosopumilaceae archaeon]NIX60219.1 hypothetical protein [Nitrosopumilaceae archaeon]